jgi:hypothetical protein
MTKEVMDTISKTVLGLGFLWFVYRMASTPEGAHLLRDPWLMASVVTVVTGGAALALIKGLNSRGK